MKDSDRKELVAYRLNKARETIGEVDILLKNGLWNTAVNRMYYACYYAVTALLIDNSIHPQTHAGVRQMFGLHFIKTGRISKDLGKYYSDIFDKRQTGDYEDYIEFEAEEVSALVHPAQSLIESISQIIAEEH
jgi:uncharacterized protein (UPF0332 family)